MLIVGKRDVSEPGGPERGNISIKATAREQLVSLKQ